MQWLLELETERDPISTCRLMNIFRRKGVSVLRLELESRPASYAMMALVETRESEVAHVFHFLRRTEGVREVTCYRHEPSTGVSGDGAWRTAKLDSSRIIHTSRAMDAQNRTIGARSNEPIETGMVG